MCTLVSSHTSRTMARTSLLTPMPGHRLAVPSFPAVTLSPLGSFLLLLFLYHNTQPGKPHLPCRACPELSTCHPPTPGLLAHLKLPACTFPAQHPWALPISAQPPSCFQDICARQRCLCAASACPASRGLSKGLNKRQVHPPLPKLLPLHLGLGCNLTWNPGSALAYPEPGHPCPQE